MMKHPYFVILLLFTVLFSSCGGNYFNSYYSTREEQPNQKENFNTNSTCQKYDKSFIAINNLEVDNKTKYLIPKNRKKIHQPIASTENDMSLLLESSEKSSPLPSFTDDLVKNSSVTDSTDKSNLYEEKTTDEISPKTKKRAVVSFAFGMVILAIIIISLILLFVLLLGNLSLALAAIAIYIGVITLVASTVLATVFGYLSYSKMVKNKYRGRYRKLAKIGLAVSSPFAVLIPLLIIILGVLSILIFF